MNETKMIQKWLADTVGKINAKMEWVSEKSKAKIPYTTLNGVHDDKAAQNEHFNKDDGINWWTNGFWAGILWQMYHSTGEEKYKEIAAYSETLMDVCFEDFYGLHHDVGFMWLPTAVVNYELTGNIVSKRRALHAANLLAGRFNCVGKFIRAWNDLPDQDTRGWAIIDCMLNLPLLYWATEETGDPRYKHIASAHADTAMDTFVRADGSVNHIVAFDPFIGGVIKTYGGQGYGEGSAWTRGQAWAIYGFMMSYMHTGKRVYLNTAQKVAHYFIANMPESGLIPVDFRQPKEPMLEDSTAAAIAAGGLIELAKCVEECDAKVYRNAAIKLLQALTNNRCDWSKECDCIVQKGSAAYHTAKHHECIIYGDYFFIEAVLKLNGNAYSIW